MDLLGYSACDGLYNMCRSLHFEETAMPERQAQLSDENAPCIGKIIKDVDEEYINTTEIYS